MVGGEKWRQDVFGKILFGVSGDGGMSAWGGIVEDGCRCPYHSTSTTLAAPCSPGPPRTGTIPLRGCAILPRTSRLKSPPSKAACPSTPSPAHSTAPLSHTKVSSSKPRPTSTSPASYGPTANSTRSRLERRTKISPGDTRGTPSWFSP